MPWERVLDEHISKLTRMKITIAWSAPGRGSQYLSSGRGAGPVVGDVALV